MTQELRDAILVSAKAIIVATEKVKQQERVFKDDNAPLLKRISDLQKHCEVLQTRYDKSQAAYTLSIEEQKTSLQTLHTNHAILKRTINDNFLLSLEINSSTEAIEAYKTAQEYGKEQSVIIMPSEADLSSLSYLKIKLPTHNICVYTVVAGPRHEPHWKGSVAVQNKRIMGCFFNRLNGTILKDQMWVKDLKNHVILPRTATPYMFFKDTLIALG